MKSQDNSILQRLVGKTMVTDFGDAKILSINNTPDMRYMLIEIERHSIVKNIFIGMSTFLKKTIIKEPI